MLTNLFGWNRLSRLEAEQSGISMTVIFDYNKRNFVSASEPTIVPFHLTGRFADDLRNGYASLPSPPENYCKAVILLAVEGMAIGSIMPFNIEKPAEALTKSSWTQLEELLNEVKLVSSKFTDWDVLLQRNFKSSISDSVRTHTQFQPFLTNALWIESTRSRHKTHVITVEIEMGHGLGEIKRLVSYTVRPVSEVRSYLEQRGPLSAEMTHCLDLENSPQLLRSRAQHPYNCLIPVLFFCPRTHVATLMPNFIEVFPNHATYPVKQCDKKAKAAFCKLEKVRFPSVQSPVLH